MKFVVCLEILVAGRAPHFAHWACMTDSILAVVSVRNGISYLSGQGISAVFHYILLYTSPTGKKYGGFYSRDEYPTKESERLLWLPMRYVMERDV